MKKITFLFSLFLMVLLGATTAKAQAVTSLDDLSNNAAYVIKTETRGWIVYDESNPNAAWYSSTGDATNANHQWAILTTEGGRYLYNIGNKKFLYKSGNYTSFTDEPVAKDVNLLASTGGSKANYPWVIALGSSHMGISTGYTPPVITFYNDLGDGGNMVAIEKVADFDPTAALAVISSIENQVQNSEEYATLQGSIETAMPFWIAEYQKTTGLITSVDQLSTNADQNSTGRQDGGGLAALIDNKTNTYFHSSWEGDPTAEGEAHCLEVELPNAVGDFCFYFDMRRNGTSVSNRPCIVTVYGKTADTEYTKIKTIDYDLELSTTALPVSFWGIVNGGEYTHFRFDVEETNTSSKFFTASEFQMYAVPAEEGNAKTIAEYIDTYFSLTTVEEATALNANVLALTDALLYSDEAAEALKTEAEKNLAKIGLGYPVSDDETRTQLAEAIASDKGTLGNKAYIMALDEALDAYKASTNVQMPADGQAFVLMNVLDVNQKALKYTANDWGAEYQNCDVTNIEDVDLAFVYVCHKMADGQYVFVNNAGKYLAFKGKSGNTNTVNGNKGYTDAYDATYSHHDVVKGTRFGHFAIKGHEKTRQVFFTRSNADDVFNQGTGQIDATNATHSTNFLFIEYPYANKVTMNAAAGIENVDYIATFSAPFATVIPEGVTAYYAEEDATANTITLKAVEGEAIPANQGVLLTAATADAVTMAPAATEVAADLSANKLGNTAGAAAEINGYILTKKNDKVAFYAVSANNTLGMNKAYLPTLNPGSVLYLNFGGETTGIESVEAENGTQVVFDLSGRRVQKAQKGLYIINGKKVLVK